MNTDDPLRYAHRHLPWRSADLLPFNCRISALSTCFQVSRLEHVFSYSTSAVKSLRVRRFVVSCHAFYRSTPWLCAWLQTSSRRFPRRFGARHFVVQCSANLQIPWANHETQKNCFGCRIPCVHPVETVATHIYLTWGRSFHAQRSSESLQAEQRIAVCSGSSLRHLKFPFPKSVSTMVQNVFAVTFFRLYLQDSAYLAFVLPLIFTLLQLLHSYSGMLLG